MGLGFQKILLVLHPAYLASTVSCQMETLITKQHLFARLCSDKNDHVELTLGPMRRKVLSQQNL